MRRDIILLYSLLAAANLGACGWAFLEFGRNPVLLGTAFLAYGFGLRHAVDADHIAAIDNVTRKLLAERRGALGVGFFFSLGHSTVVVAASIAVAFATGLYRLHADSFHQVGGVFGTVVSAGFLFVIALANLVTFWSVFQRFGRGLPDDDVGSAAKGGILARLFRPVFAIVSRSWHMYPLGFLFGLGFDTATEIGLLGISAAEGARGLSVGAMLVFPALFTAGMSLIDTTDSLLMLKVYGWASASPFRRQYYNMAITLGSALVALVVGGIEELGLVGMPWHPVEAHFGAIGSAIIAAFLILWGGAVLFDRLKRYDGRLDAPMVP
jgi:nickel/cobalt transporter (NiCoT) family protein